MLTIMPRYLFNFIGEDGKTFSDSVEMDEYREPDILQRWKARSLPTWDHPIVEPGEPTVFTENFRRRAYRGPKHHSWDADDVFYVHPTITDEQAMEIVSKRM